jgi:transcriptional regulator with XRE-family HTH domain
VQTTQRISKFYEDLETLGLKFPGKEISKKLGISKGYVSDILNKKKEPSEDFLNDFYKMFSIGSPSNDMNNYTLPLGDLKITLSDYFELLKEQKRKAEEREKEYLEIIKTKLISIDANSKEMAEDIEALTTEIQAEHRAMMDTMDVAAKQPIGTTRAAAGTAELISEQKHSNKGSQTGIDKNAVTGKKR